MDGGGRKAQKDRTRRAILDGARGLMRQGKPVTVAAAAEEQGISKATAYRYFSDAAMLVAEAGLDLKTQDYETVTAGATGLRDRLCCISLYFFDLALQNEAAFRTFVGMSLMAWKPDEDPRPLRRAGRRVAMFQRAFRDGDGGLSPEAQDHVILALSSATGTEAMIALLDVAGTDPATARETVRDVALAILARHLGPDA
jgi:AcrR family transcriptional regulator